MKVLITGASKGIGEGIARVLAASGHSLGLVARSEDLLDKLKSELSSSDSVCETASAEIAPRPPGGSIVNTV